ncbi:N-6 DNA methylase [Spirosoma sp. HMF3257]|uniref:site-specific DNA-methyltransferase (adenine-specific) n=1 Tax=Spirosoma telluris TaxID=2183553 RepID=A0A327NFR2_9BACT|nr:N-6 DNA methylase [Spirosoma telluris]RAI72894.1 SAM-dependent DNA methyltransferase [Spirosoma telluris]
MTKEFFKTLNNTLSSDPNKVNRIIVSTFLSLNKLNPKNSSLINKLIIREGEEDWEEYCRFKKYFHSYQQEFSFEDLIEIFERIVSPADKKVNGAIYTPDLIKSYIIEQVTTNSTIDLAQALVCDVACGCGGFLYSYARFLRESYALSYEYIYRELIYGVDIASYSIERSAITLSLLAIGEGEDSDFQFNLKEGNSLNFDWRAEFERVGQQDGFDLVIGNPPYVCAKNILAETRALLERWPVSSSGNPDLYIPFFQIGLEALNENGILGYITVNSFTRSVNGRKLREYFHKASFALTIVDFGGEQVFKGRTTYTCICIIGKQPRPFVQYCLNSSTRLSMLTANDFVHIPYDTLTDHSGWILSQANIKTVLHRLRSSGSTLEQVAEIRGGFATLKNQIFVFTPRAETPTHFLLETKTKATYWIERGICRNAIKANSLKTDADFDTYLEKIIFPYQYRLNETPLFVNEPTINRRVVPLEETELATRYPDAYHYLCDHREELALRDKGETRNYPAWYAYGRSQGLNVQGHKLLFPHISDRPYFVYTPDTELLFYTGFSIVSWNVRTLKILQKVLSSDLFWFFVRHSSKPYSGDYFGLGKNYIKDFSIPVFNKKEEDYLLMCTDPDEINAFLATKYNVFLPIIVNQLAVVTE